MSILSRPKLSPQQRFDLEDWNALLAALCGDSKLRTQKFWSSDPYILNGFVTSGIGNTTATVGLAGGALIAAGGGEKQSWFVGASSEPSRTVALQAGTKNYLEISLAYVGATELLRAFWDATANGGVGAEFNQLTDTIQNLEVTIETSISGFSGDADKIPLSIVETNGAGSIVGILDQRKGFGRLGQPQDEDRNFAWGTNEEVPTALTLSGIVGSFTVGETITFDGAETAEVVSFSGSNLGVKDISSPTFSMTDPIVGLSSGATATLDTYLDGFTGADKDLGTLKENLDAIKTEIKFIKGVKWFERNNNSLNGLTQFLNSIITQNVAGASYAWDGSALSITDDSGSPANGDELAGLRILGNSQDLLLTRQDAASAAIAIADGEVMFVKLPDSGDRTYSDAGSGDTNYQVVTKPLFEANDTNYWIAYREGDRLYVRGYGELQPGEEAPISDPAKAELEAQINANQAKVNQDRSSKLIEGGSWHWDEPSETLSSSADAYIQVGGLLNPRNTISAQIINLPNPTSVAYVEINREGSVTDILPVSVTDIDSLTITDDTVIIARRVSGGVIVGTSSFLLKDGEYLELDGALAEINRLLNQVKLVAHETDDDKARIQTSEIPQLDGSTLNQVVGSFMLKFDGAVIDFTTGEVFESDGSTPLGVDFAPQTIPVGEYFWYGLSLLPDTINALNQQLAKVNIDLGSATDASASSAPIPLLAGSIKLGWIQVQNNGGSIEINDVRRLGPGTGSGSGGQGFIKVDYYDPISTSLPVGAAVTIDGQPGVDGDTVLFSNLVTDNNRVYELSGVGVAIAWSPVRAFDNQFDPEDGDITTILKGDAFQEQTPKYNGTKFLVNDVIRLFDDVSGNYWELGSIKTTNLVNNTSGNVFSINASGSENLIIGYSLTRGINKETGQLFVTSNGTDCSANRVAANLGLLGVEFEAVINAGDLELNYTTENQGIDATMKFYLHRWSNSAGGPTGVPSYTGAGGSSTAAAGNIGEVQYHGALGDLDAESRFKWDSAEGAILLDGLKISSLKGPITINDNVVAPALLVSFPVSTYNFSILEYSIKRGTAFRVGRILIPNSAASADFSDDFVEINSSGVTFTISVASGSVELRYLSTSTGVTGEFKYSIRQWA